MKTPLWPQVEIARLFKRSILSIVFHHFAVVFLFVVNRGNIVKSATIQRLELLPEVFSLSDLTTDTHLGDLAMTPEAAKKFLLRAGQNNRIAKASSNKGRAGYYYNLVRDPDGPINRPIEVAHLLYEEAMVIGLSVLHTYGWVTQIPRTVDIAISASRRCCPSVNGVNFYFRSTEWFKDQFKKDAVLGHDESEFVLPSLTPRAALEDLKKNGVRDGAWIPKDDDLYIPADDEEGVRRKDSKRRITRDR